MNRGRLWMVGAVGLLGFALSGSASAQISAYVDLSATKLTNLVKTETAINPTFGLQGQVGKYKRLRFYGDARAFYLSAGSEENGPNNLSMAGLSVGPKISIQGKKFEPYLEALVGFGRFNDGLNRLNSKTTDAQVELNFGLDRQVTKRFDWRIFDVGYRQFYALGGEYNPKTFSTGVVFHITPR